MGRLEKKSGSERLVACAALKRFGPPKEFTELLAFCAISKPGYFTGVDMLCDGGTRPDSP
jgi:NAD(P)-dependent dehydrogenase (short-subunit alcohol dehydrogenase family)